MTCFCWKLSVLICVIVLSVANGFLHAPLGFSLDRRTRSSEGGRGTRDSSFTTIFSASDEDLYYYDIVEQSYQTSGRSRGPLRRSKGTLNGIEDENEAARRRHALGRHEYALQDPTLLTNIEFSNQTLISPPIRRALTEVLGVKQMTEIQAKSFSAALNGENVLGHARTGTGKTLAFLLPSIERLLAGDLNFFIPGQSIGMIIIAPTRELAVQIATQAKDLLSFRDDMGVACFYGGTRLIRDYRVLTNKLPAILVVTPGRFLEHLESTKMGRQTFTQIIRNARIIVLDEADRLLDGFAHETRKIFSRLPRWEKRQTLLFSATVPHKLRSFVTDSLKVNVTEIDCVANASSNSKNGTMAETNIRVDQSYLLLDSIADYISTLEAILRKAMKEDKNNYKILVFFPASRLVRFFFHFFKVGLKIPVMEIHSRMSQGSRSRTSRQFLASKRAILFTSDVSARGVDYPDVNLVIQYGAPLTNDLYIHRLGRTARAGRNGRGILVLMPFEQKFLKRMRRRGIQMKEADLVMGIDETSMIQSARRLVRSGHAVLTPNAEAACRSFLAYYVANSGGLEPSEMLLHIKDFAEATGLATIPTIESKIATRLGLKGLVRTE